MRRILLVEDHASFRQTLAFVFDQQHEFEVVAQAGTLAEARRAMDGAEADLGVIDLTLPDGEGTELIEELREANPDFVALVLTASLDRTEHARRSRPGRPASCTSQPMSTRYSMPRDVSAKARPCSPRMS